MLSYEKIQVNYVIIQLSFYSEDPCVLNPCHDGATCQRMDTGDKYQCICPDIDHNGRCSGGKPKMFLRVP